MGLDFSKLTIKRKNITPVSYLKGAISKIWLFSSDTTTLSALKKKEKKKDLYWDLTQIKGVSNILVTPFISMNADKLLNTSFCNAKWP